MHKRCPALRVAFFAACTCQDEKSNNNQRTFRAHLQEYPDVLYGRFTEPGGVPLGDIIYFDYGCVVFWGLTQEQEQVRCLINDDVETKTTRRDVDVLTQRFCMTISVSLYLTLCPFSHLYS